ncbi:MAG: TolC family protein [Tannerella sp.]|jgi:cobalt-zinc-cadmium efflux system outer membrane protein|nr:TolC family protein [Tannerella sp.]
MNIKYLIIGAFVVPSWTTASTPADSALTSPLGYNAFMEQVLSSNLGYAAEKLNLSEAEANLKAAKVFNDPSLSVGYADNDDRRMQMGRSVEVELSKTITVGKRSANIDLATSEKELNEALLEDFFHSLRAEATAAYLEAVKQRELYAVKEDSYQNILRLADADSIRLQLGEITIVDATHSRLEAEIAANELLEAHTEMINACSSLALWTGSFDKNLINVPAGKFENEERLFSADELLRTALENRADLAAAMKNVDVAQRALKVVKRERNMDFDVALGYNFNTEVRNEIAPAPQFNGISIGIAVPLKFSNANKGAVHAAEYRRQQAELNYQQAELEVQTSVMQSLRKYQSATLQARRFETGMMDKALSILNGKIYSYQRGETSRLEVLSAQQTYDDLRTSYIEALFNSLVSLVELERNAGIWDVVIRD